MNDELNQFDADLKGLFVENNIDEIKELLGEQPDDIVKEIMNYNWNIIKKYYDKENFELLMKHFKFVAYTCFIVEYTFSRGIIGEDVFGIMMLVYNDIYEIKKENNQQ